MKAEIIWFPGMLFTWLHYSALRWFRHISIEPSIVPCTEVLWKKVIPRKHCDLYKNYLSSEKKILVTTEKACFLDCKLNLNFSSSIKKNGMLREEACWLWNLVHFYSASPTWDLCIPQHSKLNVRQNCTWKNCSTEWGGRACDLHSETVEVGKKYCHDEDTFSAQNGNRLWGFFSSLGMKCGGVGKGKLQGADTTKFKSRAV